MRDRILAFLVLLPSVLAVGVFVYGFIGQNLWVSLTDWGKDPAQALALRPELRFVGLENYRELFTGFVDVRFRQSVVNLIFFTLFFMAGSLGLGLLLALAVDRAPKGEGFFRTVFLFPMSLSFVVTGTIWRWMLQPQGGVNVLPTLFGLPPLSFPWLATREQVLVFDWNHLPFYTALAVGLVLLYVAYAAHREGERRRFLWALLSAGVLFLWAFTLGRGLKLLPYPETHGFSLALVGVILAAVWQMSGYTMALYLAGLRGIPVEVLEAARVDGASEWQLFRRIIFPMLAPITLSAMIVLGHIALKIFDLVFAMAGLDYAPTDVPAIYMYLLAFRGNQFAKGAAIGILLLLLVAVVVVPYLASQLRKEVRR
ncbi:ABC-type transporter, integral membrane subunit [Thermus thermophilus SG0.5JP17-16]|uniref:ABC-type transporter, integral membrane subunit n=1 Tax=Thermus thermophilus (strain SG0.5JP17-16) TaxID=762633 RepID=F6DFF1_THETG|nr:ABC transporter permease subunit [Thermus thermophilus]AEG33109.1 ABC-type transporter, integral membrane subunit [Thermus thermophilus SG0.5JP17-16]